MATRYWYKNKPHLYNAWSNMMRRCYLKSGKDYKNYGGRGITVCKEWQNPLNFRRDMESTYKKGLSLDRINNDIGYSKANCRWTTRTEQNNNTRRNHLFGFNGIEQTLTGWSKTLGVKRSTLAQRFYVYKWTIDQTLKGN